MLLPEGCMLDSFKCGWTSLHVRQNPNEDEQMVEMPDSWFMYVINGRINAYPTGHNLSFLYLSPYGFKQNKKLMLETFLNSKATQSKYDSMEVAEQEFNKNIKEEFQKIANNTEKHLERLKKESNDISEIIVKKWDIFY